MNLRRVGVVGLLFLSALMSINAQVSFEDKSFQSGIFNLGSNHGVSFGDINNDGLEDVYISVREEGVPNRLFLNRGNVVFEEIGEAAGVNSVGVTTSATWGDINNDGFIDLYIGNTGTENILYLNNGDLTFTDITLEAGVGDPFDPRSVHFADVDNDGWLDIYVHNYGTENVLYKNNGDITFLDFTQESQALDIGPAMGTIFFDMDDDGDQDLYVLNDGSKNALFENLGGGRFQNVSEGSGLDIHCSCMGVDFADYDQDGDYDMYITNYGVNFLFENNGDGTFTDRADEFEVDDYGMGWGTFWFDYDNDGDQDIYLANHQFISSRPNILYRNDGGSSFPSVSEDANIESPYASFGTAAGDVNNDGLLDIVVANWGGNARNRLYVNSSEENASILIKAKGTVSNASAIGTNVIIKTGDRIQMDQINGATGYASQSSLVLHFGLGQSDMIDEMTIKWPSGIVESYYNLPVNQYYTVTEEGDIVSEAFEDSEVTSLNEDEFVSELSYPNPFSESTFIPAPNNASSDLKLEIYSNTGEVLFTSTNQELINEVSGFRWNGTANNGLNLTNGVYFFRLVNDHSSVLKTGKLVLNR